MVKPFIAVQANMTGCLAYCYFREIFTSHCWDVLFQYEKANH
ncbi:hypothetical protein RINTHH_11330 [Richelia intracellularis HH01]|uniref:Uncharacterized protein n=1 Tax=Richelia intracellularis HH01 TaxID=1165094 RepID=M1X052_9NOST|nr:hypothetical protein RINTHH_11330 [Richelia intracellularis HH01]